MHSHHLQTIVMKSTTVSRQSYNQTRAGHINQSQITTMTNRENDRRGHSIEATSKNSNGRLNGDDERNETDKSHYRGRKEKKRKIRRNSSRYDGCGNFIDIRL